MPGDIIITHPAAATGTRANLEFVARNSTVAQNIDTRGVIIKRIPPVPLPKRACTSAFAPFS